jgi:hypothetical protein
MLKNLHYADAHAQKAQQVALFDQIEAAAPSKKHTPLMAEKHKHPTLHQRHEHPHPPAR